ncbi:MAG: cytidylate kinase family protein [Tannerella sp.]|jgi:cytidylate kinase|nr:cytidylate kinase family protein [Tannerella sp.]
MAKIISLTGDLGSGKSTVSSILCDRLKYDYIYTGEIQRRIAAKYNMTTTELNKYSETHPEIDREIDSTFKSLNDSENLIVDSRLAWFFIPASFKVFLKTNLFVSAERIAGDTKRKSESYESKEDAAYHIIARKTSENKRYGDLYGADCSNLNNFDMVVDTSFVEPERVAGIILEAYGRRTIPQKGTLSLVSPKNLYPTRSVGDSCHEECYKNILNNMKDNGYDPAYPVTVVTVDSFDYILDGHKRTSCALKNNIDLIPMIYKDLSTCKESVPKVAGQALFRDWENFHSFKYLIYPVI